MKTINLPCEIGKKRYVIEYCSNIIGISEIVEIGIGSDGNKKKAKVITCPYEKQCQHGPMHSDACNRQCESFERKVFPVNISQYVIDKDGVYAKSDCFYFKWSVDKLFETEKDATNYLNKNRRNALYGHWI